jgi:hypothetical protein
MQINFETKPGYAELSQEQKREKIIDITIGLDRGFPKSKICSVRGDQQKLLGLLKTMKLFVDNEPGATLENSYNRATVEGSIVYQLEYINVPPGVTLKRGQTPPTPGNIDDFINYLENPPTPPNPDMEAKIAKLITFLPKEKKKKGGMTRKNHRLVKRHSRKRV